METDERLKRMRKGDDDLIEWQDQIRDSVCSYLDKGLKGADTPRRLLNNSNDFLPLKQADETPRKEFLSMKQKLLML